MDPNPHSHSSIVSSNDHQEQVEQPSNIPPVSIPVASISLTLSTLLLPPKPTPSPTLIKFSSIPTNLKLHSQLTSSLSLSSLAKPSPSHSFKKPTTFSPTPIVTPLFQTPRRSSDPLNPFGLRRASIVYFRTDLRVHDNESLTTANNESVSVLPVYVFDPKDYGKSSSGFDKTGPHRARFLIESVSDLRMNLESRGSNLVVKVGSPEVVLVELVKRVGADAVYVHKEISQGEVKCEERLEEVMKEEGVEVKYFWGSTLHHVDDLPFKLEDMPSSYGGFKEKVEKLEVRKTIEALDQLKGLPSRGDVEIGEIPSLLDLGLSSNGAMAQDGKPLANASLIGGETKALQRLREFAAECWAQPNNASKDGTQTTMYGANFSCKISPWLSLGCLSPRFVYEELKKSGTRTISAASSSSKDGGTGMNWLLFELSWRDFFRFITKKYSSAKKAANGSPATACTGALA